MNIKFKIGDRVIVTPEYINCLNLYWQNIYKDNIGIINFITNDPTTNISVTDWMFFNDLATPSWFDENKLDFTPSYYREQKLKELLDE